MEVQVFFGAFNAAINAAAMRLMVLLLLQHTSTPGTTLM